jgi:hypothetical protein
MLIAVVCRVENGLIAAGDHGNYSLHKTHNFASRWELIHSLVIRCIWKARCSKIVFAKRGASVRQVLTESVTVNLSQFEITDGCVVPFRLQFPATIYIYIYIEELNLLKTKLSG